MVHRSDIVRMMNAGRRFIAGFDSDESGTSLTEFVITLPVFLIIFSAVLQLSRLTHESFRVKARATRHTWQEALSVFDSGPTNPSNAFGHMLPQRAGGDAQGEISGHPSPQGDNYARLKNSGLIRNGTAGEAQESVRLLGQAGLGSPSSQTPGNNVSDFPQDIVDDSRINPVARGSGPLNRFNASYAASAVAPNTVFGASTRFGMVVGEDSKTVVVAGRSFDFGAGYDVLVSPRGTEGTAGEYLTVGFSRLAAADDDCLGNLLKIGIEFDYLSNCL